MTEQDLRLLTIIFVGFVMVVTAGVLRSVLDVLVR